MKSSYSFIAHLRPGGRKEFKIYFTPEEAKVIIASAVFNFREGDKSHTSVLKMSGIGKFPFVNISEEKLNFE